MVLGEGGKVSLSFLQGMIDALPFHIAVVDSEGVICLVNEAWRAFARENGLFTDEIGVNYLEVTRRAAGVDETARQVLQSLERVLQGDDRPTFVEYPCHSPTERRYFHVHIKGFTHEGKRWILLAHENVTAEVLNREREEAMYRRFQDLFVHMREGMVLHEWIRDAKGEIVDYRIVAANNAFTNYTDLDVEKSIGMPASHLYGMFPPPYFEVYKRVYEKHQPETFETYYDPMNRYFWISAIPWGDGFATLFLDITPLKKQQQELENTLAKKHFLLRELQHRAKNTFSSIAGLIGLVALDHTDEVREILLHLKEQVLAMSKVYEILYHKGGGQVLDVSEYIQSIVDGFSKSFLQVFNDVKITLDLHPIFLSAQRANLVGLWLTEVLTNALKYAFGQERKGWLSLSLCEKEDMIELVCLDGGREEDEQPRMKVEAGSSGFGSQIMLMVVEELHGTQEIWEGDGIKIVLRFPHVAEDKEEV
ncbi:MAG: PAS domain-containing protein [Brevinematales bacterium]|nr:PAS domain-containing protein [Brevinematales bacterium]